MTTKVNRADIYQLIEAERAAQDIQWPRGPNEPHREQYHFNAPHLLLLGEKISRMRSMWYEAKKEELRAEFMKIAAIAVRAIEEVDR